MPRHQALRVTRRIYGPGATRHSSILLAVPGREYPADHVLALTGGDESLIDRDDARPVALTAAEARALDAQRIGLSSMSKIIVEDAVDPSTDTPGDDDVDPEGDDDAGAATLANLAELTVPALRQLAGERGVDVPSSATKLQIIGALNAAAPAAGHGED